jgi:hypothetical protein
MVKPAVIIILIVMILFLVATPISGFFIFRMQRQKIIEKNRPPIPPMIPSGGPVTTPSTFSTKDFDLLTPTVNVQDFWGKQEQLPVFYMISNLTSAKDVWGSGNTISVNQYQWLSSSGTKLYGVLVSQDGVFMVEQDAKDSETVDLTKVLFQPPKQLSSDAFFAISNIGNLVIYDKDSQDGDYILKYVAAPKTPASKTPDLYAGGIVINNSTPVFQTGYFDDTKFESIFQIGEAGDVTFQPATS